VYRHRLSRFEQEIVTLHPGEYFATREDFIISTVLGSCVAVALFDQRGGAGGLNHFMLPGDASRPPRPGSPDALYGMYAIEILVNEVLALGVPRERLRAKVFGGGSMFRISTGKQGTVPELNVNFALDYLARESIPVLGSDVGGVEPRKIFMYPLSGKVLMKRIVRDRGSLLGREEERYHEELEAERQGGFAGPVVLFEDPSRGGGRGPA
jgi:chemotaxis protein CheD